MSVKKLNITCNKHLLSIKENKQIWLFSFIVSWIKWKNSMLSCPDSTMQDFSDDVMGWNLKATAKLLRNSIRLTLLSEIRGFRKHIIYYTKEW